MAPRWAPLVSATWRGMFRHRQGHGMTDTAQAPRNGFGMAAIALTLGAAPLMLWMGRWRLALVYLVIGSLLLPAFVFAANAGYVPVSLFQGIEPGLTIYLAYLPLLLVALLHAFAIRKTALARPWYSRWYVALPSLVIAGLALAFAVRSFLYEPFNVPGSSMSPTLVPGDYFWVSKREYSARDPQRGDIAAFRLPYDTNITYVKRVVGLPGDRVQMKDGVLQINGSPVKLERVDDHDEDMQIEPDTLYRETLPGGVSHLIADTEPNSEADNTDEIVVPSGQYFVLGDNRDNSQDSRYTRVGVIPRENFIGPFVVRIWNDQGVPLAGRPE